MMDIPSLSRLADTGHSRGLAVTCGDSRQLATFLSSLDELYDIFAVRGGADQLIMACEP